MKATLYFLMKLEKSKRYSEYLTVAIIIAINTVT